MSSPAASSPTPAAPFSTSAWSLAAVAALAVTACATTEEGRVRELPVGIFSLGALLDGCAAEAGDDGVNRIRCGERLVLATRMRPPGVGEPTYRAEAYGMAQLAGARLVWDQATVATEGPSGIVDRARALEPGTDAHHGTLIGAVRSVGPDAVEDVWCVASEAAAIVRCEHLLGAILAVERAEGAPAGPASGPGTAQVSARPAQREESRGPVTVFGRALSLPTTCTAKAADDGGDAMCRDGTSLSWRRFDEMSEATQAVEATLAGVGVTEDAASYACTIVGEVGRCAEHPEAVAGITYVDGKPVAVLCVGVMVTRENSVCRTLLIPR